MAISKDKKAEIYQSYIDRLENAQGMVVTEYRGMTMKMVDSLRAKLREIDASFNVVKTTIFKIALKEKGFAAPDDLLDGPIAVALAYRDLPSLTKTILDQLKEQPLLIPKGAIMGETVFHERQLEALTEMPTFDEARAMLVGTLASPAQAMVNLLNAPGTEMVNLLQQPGVVFARLLQAYHDKLNDSVA